MYKLSLEISVPANGVTCAKTAALGDLVYAAVEVKFFGEELELMKSAACAANKSLSEFAAEAALEYAEMYLRTFEAASADLKRKDENGAAQHQ